MFVTVSPQKEKNNDPALNRKTGKSCLNSRVPLKDSESTITQAIPSNTVKAHWSSHKIEMTRTFSWDIRTRKTKTKTLRKRKRKDKGMSLTVCCIRTWTSNFPWPIYLFISLKVICMMTTLPINPLCHILIIKFTILNWFWITKQSKILLRVSIWTCSRLKPTSSTKVRFNRRLWEVCITNTTSTQKMENQSPLEGPNFQSRKCTARMSTPSLLWKSS